MEYATPPRHSHQPFSQQELAAFADYLSSVFLRGYDILNFTLSDINMLYIIIVNAPDVESAKRTLAGDRLTRAVHFYETYGGIIGVRTLYSFIERYYRASICAIGLSKRAFPANWYDPPTATIQLQPTGVALPYRYDTKLSAQAYWAAVHGVSPETDHLLVVNEPGGDFKRLMNKPLFEINSLRRWTIECLSREGLPFSSFANVVLASYWYESRADIVRYFETTAHAENRAAILHFLEACTCESIFAEALKAKLCVFRFADVFPEVLVTALISCHKRLTGRQLAGHLFMCAIDLAGDAKEINREACMKACYTYRKAERAHLLRLKVEYLCYKWSPALHLTGLNLEPWKGKYTVRLLDEYINIIRKSTAHQRRNTFGRETVAHPFVV